MSDNNKRRSFIGKLTLLLSVFATVPGKSVEVLADEESNKEKTDSQMNPILDIKPLGFQWDTQDPFLFCVHHEDQFPKGNDQMGPTESYLKGRSIGDDFIIKDGFRMYHGKQVPGFPGHPHRGFETVTVVRKGIVDHSDSLGAAGRYGNGDVQWMTAGKGVQHAEMFPLIYSERENPLELFQIWLNLPKANKMVEPHFKMLWKEAIPRHTLIDSQNKKTVIEVIAGQIGKDMAPAPPPNSWAADAKNEVLILNIRMDAGTTWKLPAASEGINRTLYFYEGDTVNVANREITNYSAVFLKANVDLEIKTTNDEVSILILQGKPINEPTIQYGPFVMNTKAEIHQAFDDYHKTQFGGWPWQQYDHVHAKNKMRFALHADGKLEEKDNLG